MQYTTVLTHQPGQPWRAIVPALPDCVAEAPESTTELTTVPLDLMGIFQDDPQWGQIFDEIEQRRNEHLIGG